jgi:hypothetical protein
MKRFRAFPPVVIFALCICLLGGASSTLAQAGSPAAPPVDQQGADTASAPASADAVQTAPGTTFTYQGNLKKSGQPVNTTCSFQFSLWDAQTGGMQMGTTQTINNTSVQAGVFTVQLDFGNQFTGDTRWLQTAVQCAGDGSYVTLSPRQPLNAVPYALGLRPGAQVTGASNTTDGIIRATNSGAGAALVGMATSTTGATYGVLGNAFSPNGFAVWGYANGGATGVAGVSAANGPGVSGSSATGWGVFGETTVAHTTSVSGVYGKSTGDGGIGVIGEAMIGNSWGVYGVSADGAGVYGDSAKGLGVWGQTGGGTGVFGEAVNGTGVYGSSGSGTGVFGYSSSGDAGRFDGNVWVTGNLSKGGGSFKIDHPLDPANKYLYHSFVESPDMMNIYNGNITTGANGEAIIQLPDWFEALNQDFRYQLTPIAQFAQAMVLKEIANSQFTIKTDKPNVKVSWMVTGIRYDAYANAYRIPVEEKKPINERGTYLHPELYGQPEERGITYMMHLSAVQNAVSDAQTGGKR